MDIEILTKKLKSGEFDKSVKDFVKKKREKDLKTKEFINSKKFKKQFKKLKKYLKENKSYGTDGIYYTETEKEQKFSDRAITIFETVDKNVSNHRNDPNATFSTTVISYNGVEMSVTYGQGCFFSFWLKEK